MRSAWRALRTFPRFWGWAPRQTATPLGLKPILRMQNWRGHWLSQCHTVSQWGQHAQYPYPALMTCASESFAYTQKIWVVTLKIITWMFSNNCIIDIVFAFILIPVFGIIKFQLWTYSNLTAFLLSEPPVSAMSLYHAFYPVLTTLKGPSVTGLPLSTNTTRGTHCSLSLSLWRNIVVRDWISAASAFWSWNRDEPVRAPHVWGWVEEALGFGVGGWAGGRRQSRWPYHEDLSPSRLETVEVGAQPNLSCWKGRLRTFCLIMYGRVCVCMWWSWLNGTWYQRKLSARMLIRDAEELIVWKETGKIGLSVEK